VDGPAACTTLAADAAIVQLTDAPGLNSYPSLAAAGDGFAVAWADDRENPGGPFYGTRQIFFNRVDATGHPLDADVALTQVAQGDAWRPSLARGSAGYGVAYGARDGISFVSVDDQGAVQGPTPVMGARYDHPRLAWAGDGFPLPARADADGPRPSANAHPRPHQLVASPNHHSGSVVPSG
jgi:hypothetical protein